MLYNIIIRFLQKLDLPLVFLQYRIFFVLLICKHFGTGLVLSPELHIKQFSFILTVVEEQATCPRKLVLWYSAPFPLSVGVWAIWLASILRVQVIVYLYIYFLSSVNLYIFYIIYPTIFTQHSSYLIISNLFYIYNQFILIFKIMARLHHRGHMKLTAWAVIWFPDCSVRTIVRPFYLAARRGYLAMYLLSVKLFLNLSILIVR